MCRVLDLGQSILVLRPFNVTNLCRNCWSTTSVVSVHVYNFVLSHAGPVVPATDLIQLASPAVCMVRQFLVNILIVIFSVCLAIMECGSELIDMYNSTVGVKYVSLNPIGANPVLLNTMHSFTARIKNLT